MRKLITVNENVRIRATPVTQDSFSPFGKLIDVAASGERTDRADGVEHHQTNPVFHLSTAGIAPSPLPFSITMMERHEFSSQSFLPLDAARYLLCVAKNDSDGWPIMTSLQAFTVPKGVGITYRTGVWHHPMIALDAPASFAIVMWYGDKPNEEFVDLSNPVAISAT
jgi:ureidoglycolate lyase